MAASSQVSRNKRGRGECLSSGLASPDAKRTNSGTLGQDSDLIAFLEKIDNMDNNEEVDAVNEVEGEMVLNMVIKSLEDKIGLNAQTNIDIESSDEKGSTDQVGSKKQGELTAERNSEAISVTSDIGHFTYYDDVRGETGFFVDDFTWDILGIMQNHIDENSIADLMYSDAIDDNGENTEVFYGSLWDDIWQFNEHPVTQNDFALQQQEEFRRGANFNDVWD